MHDDKYEDPILDICGLNFMKFWKNIGDPQQLSTLFLIVYSHFGTKTFAIKFRSHRKTTESRQLLSFEFFLGKDVHNFTTVCKGDLFSSIWHSLAELKNRPKISSSQLPKFLRRGNPHILDLPLQTAHFSTCCYIKIRVCIFMHSQYKLCVLLCIKFGPQISKIGSSYLPPSVNAAFGFLLLYSLHVHLLRALN